MAKPKVGAQLYSVRQYIQDIEGVAETFRKIAEIGYTTCQVSGIGDVDYKEVAKISQDTGVTICCTHRKWDEFRNNLDHLIEVHKAWNCNHPAIGSLPGEYMTPDGVKAFRDELAPIAERLAEEGMDFSFHNHNRELVHYDGKPWLAHLYDGIDGTLLKAELDVYWVAAGGGDPAQWIRKCGGREPLVHFKDAIITEDREWRFAPVGEGNLNWQAILAACEDGGVEYALIEQDNCYGEDPFDCLARSYANCRKMGLA